MNFQNCRWEIVLKELGTNSEQGLTDKQAADRLGIYGKNGLAEKKHKNIVQRFFAQLNDFMILILLFAAAISVVVSTLQGESDFVDAVIILAIVCLNAVMGLIQESKAEKALEALKKMSAPKAKVLRNGAISLIDTELLTQGDIVILEAGDFVPADARIIIAHNLKADESALTGESLPVEKDADRVFDGETAIGDCVNMVFSGTSISYGRGTVVVTKTGMNTEVGKIAEMIISNETPETPLQMRLDRTGKILGIGALIICALVFVCGLFRSIPPFEMFMTSVSLAVAAIPEGLPAIVTIMLALGVSRMAKQGAIIRRLPAVETLGQATVICSDKTGTLTQNKMKVTDVSDGFSRLARNDDKRINILKYATLCSDCEQNSEGEIIGDPTETAIVIAAENSGLSKRQLNGEFERVGEIPFESKRKLMTAVFKRGGEYLTVTKGAPDVLVRLCSTFIKDGKRAALTQHELASILRTNADYAKEALRVIAVAIDERSVRSGSFSAEATEKNLTFVGLICMLDPPRDEAFGAVKTCLKAGIKPVMITGDHILTANAIARKLGILKFSDKSMTGEELDKTSQTELCDNIYKYSVFARVTPEHKMRIVQAFQERGNIVAMTGDGVNDAPALKAADIGCAMGIAGTDVAKAAADMILTDDNFATIVYTVKEGRAIYSNVRKSVHFLLSSNIGEIITIFAALLLGWKTPLIAIHLLWVNLVTDSLPAIALGLDPAEPGIMNKKPFAKEKSLFSEGLWQKIVFEGLMIGMLALLAFGVGSFYFAGGSHMIGGTMAFATLSLSQLVHAFNMRSEKSLFAADMLGNPYLIGALVIGTILQVSVIMFEPLAKIFKVVGLDAKAWLIVVFLSIMPLVIVEIEKFVLAHLTKKSANVSNELL